MNFLQNLKSTLLANTSISTLTGGTRIYPMPAPQGAKSTFITFEITSSQSVSAKDGTPATLYRLEIVAHAPRYADAILLENQIRVALDHQSVGSGGAKAEILVYQDSKIEHRQNPNYHMAVCEFTCFARFRDIG